MLLCFGCEQCALFESEHSSQMRTHRKCACTKGKRMEELKNFLIENVMKDEKNRESLFTFLLSSAKSSKCHQLRKNVNKLSQLFRLS